MDPSQDIIKQEPEEFDDEDMKFEKNEEKNSVVSFVSILYQMVDSKENQNLITWNAKDNGHSFIIVDPVTFSREVLPKFYKHTNFCGFTRQLTLYGFKKVCNFILKKTKNKKHRKLTL